MTNAYERQLKREERRRKEARRAKMLAPVIALVKIALLFVTMLATAVWLTQVVYTDVERFCFGFIMTATFVVGVAVCVKFFAPKE